MADDKKKAEATYDPKKTSYPFVLWLALPMLIVALGYHVVFATVEATKPVDDRDAPTMTEQTMHQRRRLDRDTTGDFGEKEIKYWTGVATAQMQLNNFWESPKPTLPDEPKKPEGKNPLHWIKYREAMKDYKRAVDLLPLRTKLWADNNKTRGEHVYVPGLLPAQPTPEEKDKKATQYLLRSNLESFIARPRLWMVLAKFNKLRNIDAWDGQIGWIEKDFEEYKKSVPAKEREAKGWEAEAYKKHVDKVYLSRPLRSPEWVDGSCVRTWEGTTLEDGQELKAADKALRAANKTKDEGVISKAKAKVKEILERGRCCLLVEPLAEAVTRANRRMHQAGMGEIRPMTCFRNNLQQAILWTYIPGKEARLPSRRGKVSKLFGKKRIAVNPPGNSNHEQGLAMDLSDYKSAWPYLALEAGMMCNFINNDDAHCSIAEVKLTPRRITCKKLLDAYAKGGKLAGRSKIARGGLKLACGL